MMEEIRFGTDGWRGRIASEFSFRNVRRAADALARVLPPRSRVALGGDHRFLSEEFARAAANVLAARGHRPVLADGPATSPALSFALKGLRAAAGVMITASHNPPVDNGFKIKIPPGRSAPPEWTARLENALTPEDPNAPPGPLERFPVLDAYAAGLLARRDPRLWRGKKFPVVVDAMHGSGGRVWARLFAAMRWPGTLLRDNRDPLFGGTPPEPIEKNLAPLVEAVRARKAALGLALDGDADRLGVVDDTGTYLPPHTVFPLLLQHLTENRRLKGAVVQAVSLGYVSERLARAKGLPWGEVPVGFKHVADVMGKKRVLLGGEESGGYGVGLWSPERDGVLMGLLLMELVAAGGRPLSVLVRELAAAHGASSFQRADTPLRAPVVNKNLWTEAVSKRVPEKFAGRVVKERRTLDGLKVVFDDASWVLLRPSGTEPLLRVYAETPEPARTAQLVAKAQEWAAVRA